MPAPVNPFKAALARGERQIGCWAGFAEPYATEVLAEAGYSTQEIASLTGATKDAAE